MCVQSMLMSLLLSLAGLSWCAGPPVAEGYIIPANPLSTLTRRTVFNPTQNSLKLKAQKPTMRDDYDLGSYILSKLRQNRFQLQKRQYYSTRSRLHKRQLSDQELDELVRIIQKIRDQQTIPNLTIPTLRVG